MPHPQPAAAWPGKSLGADLNCSKSRGLSSTQIGRYSAARAALGDGEVAPPLDWSHGSTAVPSVPVPRDDLLIPRAMTGTGGHEIS